MPDDTRFIVAAGLTVAALARWAVGEFVLGGEPLRQSAARFWLRLTAPLVAIVLLAAAMLVVINTERLCRARGVALGCLQDASMSAAAATGPRPERTA